MWWLTAEVSGRWPMRKITLPVRKAEGAYSRHVPGILRRESVAAVVSNASPASMLIRARLSAAALPSCSLDSDVCAEPVSTPIEEGLKFLDKVWDMGRRQILFVGAIQSFDISHLCLTAIWHGFETFLTTDLDTEDSASMLTLHRLSVAGVFMMPYTHLFEELEVF